MQLLKNPANRALAPRRSNKSRWLRVPMPHGRHFLLLAWQAMCTLNEGTCPTQQEMVLGTSELRENYGGQRAASSESASQKSGFE